MLSCHGEGPYGKLDVVWSQGYNSLECHYFSLVVSTAVIEESFPAAEAILLMGGLTSSYSTRLLPALASLFEADSSLMKGNAAPLGVLLLESRRDRRLWILVTMQGTIQSQVTYCQEICNAFSLVLTRPTIRA
jgi:hypothetical protein